MKEKIIVIGGKGSALVVAEQVYDAQKRGADVELLGFAFDDPAFGNAINDFPIVGKTKEIYSQYESYPDVKFVFQLYRPDLMVERIDLLNSYNIPLHRFAKFIHPTAIVSESALLGFGTMILGHCVVNANVKIGNHCTIHSNSLVGHDTTMGDYNFIAAHNVIGSNNKFGNGIFLGLNSTFNNYISIGDYAFVGMASNVIKSIGLGKKVYGNPAKEFSKAIKPL